MLPLFRLLPLVIATTSSFALTPHLPSPPLTSHVSESHSAIDQNIVIPNQLTHPQKQMTKSDHKPKRVLKRDNDSLVSTTLSKSKQPSSPITSKQQAITTSPKANAKIHKKPSETKKTNNPSSPIVLEKQHTQVASSKQASSQPHTNNNKDIAHLSQPQNKLSTEKKPVLGIVRINDCLLISTIYTGNWNIECMLAGSTDPDSWESSWHPTPMSKKVVPKDLWPVCTWLNGFGYEQLISTPDLDLDPRLGDISRTENVYLFRHGYDVSGGASVITRLGRYCPQYGKNVHPAKKEQSTWIDYIPL